MESRSYESADDVKSEGTSDGASLDLAAQLWGSRVNGTQERSEFELTPGLGGVITGTFEGRPILFGKFHGPVTPGGKDRITLLREDADNLYLYTGRITVISEEPPRLEAHGMRIILGKLTDARGANATPELRADDDWVGTRPPT